MTDQDPDARIPDPETAPPSDADLVLDAQPVFEPDATPVDAPDPDAGTVQGSVAPEPPTVTEPPSTEEDPGDAHTVDTVPGAPRHEEAPAGGAPSSAAEPPQADTPVVLPTTVETAVPVDVAETIDVRAPQEPAAADLPEVSRDPAPADTTTTTSHHIPAVPVSDQVEPPTPPSSTPGEDADPEGTPPDVLGNRSPHHTHGHAATTTDATTDAAPVTLPDTSAEADPAAAGTATAQRGSIMPTPVEPDGPVAPHAHGEGSDGEVGDDDLDQTRVHRRSFVSPQEASEEDPGEAQWRPRSSTEEDGSHSATTPRSLDDALFEGATVVPEVPSRAGAHVWSLILTLLLVPLAWYLLADAGARMTLATDNPMTTGVLNPAALAELAGGIILVVLIAVLARHSSLGAHVIGIVVTVLGLPWVVAPGASARLVLPAMEWLDQWNAFGANLAHHVQSSGYSGRLLLAGVVLLLLGWTSHRVRRAGRDEEVLRAEVERVNPQGAHLTWRERRRAARAAGEH
ncbi:MAG: hypothetical protein ACTJGR_01855 [Pauljensenia sp.]